MSDTHDSVFHQAGSRKNMGRPGTPVRAGNALTRKKKHPRQQLTKQQLRDSAALDKWLSEHEVPHRVIAARFQHTEQLISHHRHGRTAITEVWMMRYAVFFDTVPQQIFPSWRWACLTPGVLPPSLSRLAPMWSRLQPEQQESVLEVVMALLRRHSGRGAHRSG